MSEQIFKKLKVSKGDAKILKSAQYTKMRVTTILLIAIVVFISPKWYVVVAGILYILVEFYIKLKSKKIMKKHKLRKLKGEYQEE
jgi:phosphate/sulfate permease